MEKAVGKASASHRSTDVYCNFEFAVRKTHSRSKASLNPACVCEIFVIFFVFRYTLR